MSQQSYHIQDVDGALYEEPGWYLLRGTHDADKPYSYMYHICTQLVNTQGQGRYKGQRQWVDEHKVAHTFSIAAPLNVHYKCSKCGFGAPEAMKGLFMLHNFDRFAE